MVMQAPSEPRDWVICLCAEWCGVCREWRGIFEQAAAARPGVRFAWVDVEDEAQAMEDFDVETFPSLLIAREGKPVFLGPVQPSVNQVTRLVDSLLLDRRAAPGPVAPEAAPLLQRLSVSVLPKL
jgi:thioredoxin 1